MKIGLTQYMIGGLAIIIIVVIAAIFFISSDQTIPADHVQSAASQTVGSDKEPVEKPTSNSPVLSQTSSSNISSSEKGARKELPPPPSRNLETGSPTWLFISLVAMAVATLASVAISFYLYRWRRLLLNDQSFAAPAEFETWVKSWNNKVSSLVQRIETDVKHFDQMGLETHQSVAKLIEISMTMQGAIDEREAEIKRLKSGHDEQIFRKYVRRFIGVGQTIEEFQQEGGADANGLKDIQDMLEDALEECGVESFQPDIGEDFRSAHGIADKPEIEIAERPEDDWRIKEVLKNGYQIRGPESSEVIIPAVVSIYRFKNEGGT